MTDALRGLRFIQISDPEDTPGDGVAATEILLGTLTWPSDDTIFSHPEGEDRNNLSRYHANQTKVATLAEMRFEGDLIFRHLPWWLSMAIRGNVTATQPDSTNEPNAWLWEFAPSLSAANTADQTNGVDTFTLEYGDNVQAYETPYCFARRIEISGAPGETTKIAVDIVGEARTDTTKTGSLSVQSVQRAPFNKSKYNRETSWAEITSGTAKTSCLKGYSWVFDTMFEPRFTGDNTFTFSGMDEDVKTCELNLILVRGTESEALRDAYEGKTTVFIRMEIRGNTELDSEQSNIPYCYIDGSYVVPRWPALNEDQGMSTVEVPLRAVYDATGSKLFQVSVRNGLEVFPT